MMGPTAVSGPVPPSFHHPQYHAHHQYHPYQNHHQQYHPHHNQHQQQHAQSQPPLAPTPVDHRPRASPAQQDFVTRTERSSARAAAAAAAAGAGAGPAGGFAPAPIPPMAAAMSGSPPAAPPMLTRRSLQAPLTEAPNGGAAGEAMPVTSYNRPRRISSYNSTSSAASSGMGVSPSPDGGINSPWVRSPASSRTSFESWDSSRSNVSAGSRRMEYPWHRPAPMKTVLRKSPPGEQFSRLPGEVLELILEEVRKSHLAPGSMSCATCMMRDLCSVALSARKWLKFARVALYEDIHLVGADSPVLKKRYKLTNGSRIVLLRRTLRNNPMIGNIVHSLKVPSPPVGMPLEEYHDLVASLVMSCPNLERLVGFHPNYNHSFTRLFHAMSTRQRLKQMDWILEASPFQRQHRIRGSSGNAAPSAANPNQRLLTPGDLQPSQSEAFLELHTNWQYLTTLSVHCLPGATLSPESLLSTTLAYLPSLQHLYLSRLPQSSFNDANLLGLPSLRTLSLSHMKGITNNGLSAFATRLSSQSIKTLTLRHMNLDSIATLCRLFSNLISLNTFSLVQSWPPTLPEDESIWLFPYLASNSIRKLHWDITSHPHCANVADSILTKSIAARGFPNLRILRAPNDPESLFQSLCKPQERADFSIDRYRGTGVLSNAQRFTPPSTPTATKSPVSPAFPGDPGGGGNMGGMPVPREFSDLRLARLAAQARLEAARRFPRYFVNVVDEDGTVAEKFGIGAFLGDVESRVLYHLLPDPGATDEDGGLVGVADLLSDGGENTANKEGCSGRWNANNGNVADKKDKERWWHTERGRWRPVTLS